MNIERLIQKDRELQETKKWTGTFAEYLKLVRKDVSIIKLAHQRIYDIIISYGIEKLKDQTNPKLRRIFRNDNLRIYNFFKTEFFGMEETISQIVRYFHGASNKGEESRQILYLVGPVGSGKSSLIEKLKRGLEKSDPVYTIEGCPIREEPLHLIPERLRPEFEKELKIKIEGSLCPICRHNLIEKWDERFEDAIIKTSSFSVQGRKGIGVVPPVDPNNQDTSVLIGGEDISKLDKFPESDPRVLDLSGAFNVGNRGIVEFIEVFKNEIEYLHTMITATQEKMIQSPGRHGMIYFDGVIVSHSNLSEWNRFKADTTNEAILDRMVTVKVPYNLELSEEIKIYKKILASSNFDVHICPHTLKIASMFAILSRLKETSKCDLLTKLKIYNGEEIVEEGKTKRFDIHELREEFKDEGMSGISTRFITKAIDNAVSDYQEEKSLDPIILLESLVKMVKKLDIEDNVKKHYLSLLQDVVHKEYLSILEKEITRAFVYAYNEQAESLFQNYLDHAEAYVNQTKVKDRITQQELEPDIDFLESIEEKIGISENSSDGFRQEVISFLWSVMRKGKKISYEDYEPIKEAIENKLVVSVKEMSRIVTTATTRDKDQRKKYDELEKRMIENGYNETSTKRILAYASANLWKK